MVLPATASAESLTLAWDACDTLPDGYRVFVRTQGQAYDYTQPAWEGSATTCTLDLPEMNTYYLVVCAYKGLVVSGDSNEVTYVVDANQAPQAVAGSDMQVEENTYVTMDGSASHDVDGTIAAYQWAQIEGPVAVLADAASAYPAFTAPDVAETASLVFELTVTDDKQATATDTCMVTVSPAAPVDTDGDGLSDQDEIEIYGTNPTIADTDGDGIADGDEIAAGTDPTINDALPEPDPDQPAALVWIEAEEGDIYAPMEIGDDPQASEAGYLWVPDGAGNGGYVEYSFEVKTAGEYVIWGRVIANDLRSDSFYISVDGSDDLAWHTRSSGQDTWGWDVVSERHHSDPREPDNPLIYYFDAGMHTLVISQREDGTRLDKVLITNDMTLVPANEVEQPEPQTEKLWFEAETGTASMPMQVGEDAAASAGGYISVPEGAGNGGDVEYSFEIKNAGEYVIWGRVIANDLRSDSFYVSVDGEKDLAWHTKSSGKDTWGWDVVSERHHSDPREPDNPLIYYFDAGMHTLVIKQREDGTKIDRILIVNDRAFVPEG